jgi:FkbM family methyltransferase
VRTLVINTYGGSLLLGASALGLEIIGSYEDTAFGMPVQQANFPHLDFRPLRKDWPTQDLSETFVIAHPPCSAFSVMTNSKAAKGVDSAAFACTKSVLQYCVDNRALGIAIESVVPALAGAWPIHQKYADDYGYNLYRILENGAMFGAQWRDRFWAVYLRKGAAPDRMPWTLYPRFQTVRQVVGELSVDEPSPQGLDTELAKLKAKFIEQAGCTPADMDFIFNRNVDDMTSVDDLLHQRRFPDQVRWDVCKQYVTKWASGAMVMLNPNGTCPVLLGGSWWHMDGRNMTEVGYKKLMGFPADYIFPEGDGSRKNNYRADFRTYLSKGVMPPIAEWVLANALNQLGAKRSSPWTHGHAWDDMAAAQHANGYHLEGEPNDIVDFRMRRKDWGQALPAIRHHDANRTRYVNIPLVESGHPNEIAVHIDVAVPAVVKQVRVPRPPTAPRRPRAPKTLWNSAEVETALAATLFTREHTADKYALYESHGYHRMGVQKDDVVLDLGAHIGCVASRAALVGAKVISVEPEPANYDLLVQNTRSFPNVTTLWGAVTGPDLVTAAGDGPREVTLHRVLRRDDGGHSTGTHSCTFKTRGDMIRVPWVSFQELLEEHQPTVLKVDTEGGELGLDWTKVPPSVRSIGIELHTQGGKNRERAKEIIAQLEVQGFRPVHRLNMESKFSAIIAFLSRDEKEWYQTRTNEGGQDGKAEQDTEGTIPAGAGDPGGSGDHNPAVQGEDHGTDDQAGVQPT